MNWITKIALKKRWITILVAAIVAGVSIWATVSLKMELIPDIEFPMTTVVTVYPQAQPEEVMNEVTVPVEGAITGIAGLKQITSTSAEGSSLVFAQFEYGTDMDSVNDTITENLSALSLPAAVSNLPEMFPELGENPRVYAIDMNMLPVVILSVNGDMAASELREIAVSQILPQLKNIEGVYDITVEGGTSDKVVVSPNLENMNQYGVSLAQIAGVLAMQEHDSLESVENAFLDATGLQLKDVAGITLGPPAGTTISRTNGKPSVNISVTKAAEANTVTTANSVLEKVGEIEESLPSGTGVYTLLDQSEYIENSISDLTNNALIGGGLAIVIVFLFLMAFRASLVTAISIPLSLLVGFLVMRFTNITINILTLSAMVIAVGRVIDNSIVILEVVYRRIQHGENFINAAMGGVREVVTPITSATVATVVIFLPLAFVGGIVGEMFIPFAWTITYALLASLVVALTVVPALSGYLVSKKTGGKERTSSWYLNIYAGMLKWCLSHRRITLVIAILLFLGSFALLPIIGTSFMPEMNINTLTIDIEMPEGSDMPTMLEVATKAEDVLGANVDVLTYNTTIGTGGANGGFGGMFGGGGGSNTISISIIIADGLDAEEMSERLNADLADITEAGAITATSEQAAMSGAMTGGLEISVRGDTAEDVIQVANQLLTELESAGEKALAHITELEMAFGSTEPGLIIEPDIAKLMFSGLSADQMQLLQQEFMLIMTGGKIGQANLGGVPREIYLEGIIRDVTDIEILKEAKIGWPTQLALGDIATIEVGDKVTKITRVDEKLAASISGLITQENVGAVNRAVQSKIDALTLPDGVKVSMGGIAEDMRESFSDMFVAIGVAMVLAYAVLVVTFRSFRNPLIIMVSMPLASIGALVGLLVTGHTLGVTGLMGVLMLVGIVLTNAVVLIAVVDQLRKDGVSSYEALVSGSQTRLRPILMTALTTMIAMVPMAFGVGEGVIMVAELAVVVIGGLFSSTLLTLLVIPVIYSMVYRIKQEEKSK